MNEQLLKLLKNGWVVTSNGAKMKVVGIDCDIVICGEKHIRIPIDEIVAIADSYQLLIGL